MKKNKEEKLKLKIPTKRQRDSFIKFTINYDKLVTKWNNSKSKSEQEHSKFIKGLEYLTFIVAGDVPFEEHHEYLEDSPAFAYLKIEKSIINYLALGSSILEEGKKNEYDMAGRTGIEIAEESIKELYEIATPKKAVDELAKLLKITNQDHHVKDDSFGKVLRLANPNNKKESLSDPNRWIIRSEDFALTWSKEAQEKFIDSITMTLTTNHSNTTDRMYDFLASQIRPIKKLTAETRVVFTIQDFIHFIGKENTKENRKEYKKHIIQELVRLHDAKVGFKQGNKAVTLSFIQGYQLLDSKTFEFATTTYYNQYINPIRRIYKTPTWLNQLNLRKEGLVRVISKKLISQLHQNAQDGNTLSLSVKKLIKACLGHLQEEAKNKTNQIRKPIEKALNRLKED